MIAVGASGSVGTAGLRSPLIASRSLFSRVSPSTRVARRYTLSPSLRKGVALGCAKPAGNCCANGAVTNCCNGASSGF